MHLVKGKAQLSILTIWRTRLPPPTDRRPRLELGMPGVDKRTVLAAVGSGVSELTSSRGYNLFETKSGLLMDVFRRRGLGEGDEDHAGWSPIERPGECR